MELYGYVRVSSTDQNEVLPNDFMLLIKQWKKKRIVLFSTIFLKMRNTFYQIPIEKS